MNCLKELLPLRTQRSIQKTCGENGAPLYRTFCGEHQVQFYFTEYSASSSDKFALVTFILVAFLTHVDCDTASYIVRKGIKSRS